MNPGWTLRRCAACGVLLSMFFSHAAPAAFPDNGYPEKGALLSHNAPEMGRLAIIETLGDYVITIPEVPSSPPNSDFLIRAWDISNPANPIQVGTFGETSHPFLAHGSIKHGNELFVGGWPNDAIRLRPDNTLVRTSWSGPGGHWNKSGMMRPWAARHWWSYGEIEGLAWLELDGVRTYEWDHLAQTGVIGFPIFMGNLMIYASDQSMTGVAAYDVSDPENPVLLDVLNLPELHPEFVDWQGNPVRYGLGGYWSEVSGHYVVFARREPNPGIQVVDFSDPSNLRLHCEMLTRDPANGLEGEAVDSDNIYVGFQDEWVFSGEFKMNIETCELDLVLDERGDRDGGTPHFVDTSQYNRPIGNLILTGGIISRWSWPNSSNGAGLGIWVHDTARDTTPPSVTYHIPRANQTNYPVMAPLSFSIPETLRSETIVAGDTVTVTEVGGGAVAIDYVLSHTGMLTVDPLAYLEPDTTYEVRLAGIEDAVGNAMPPYVFRFSTGASIDGEPPENTAPTISSITGPGGNIATGTTASFTVTASDADSDPLEYRHRIEGQPYSPWGISNGFSVLFNTAGSYTLTAQVRDPDGAAATAALNVTVIDSQDTVTPGLTGSQIDYDAGTGMIWVVNPDNDTITKIHRASRAVVDEISVGDDPRNVAVDSDGNIWVTLFGDDAVAVYDDSGQQLAMIQTGYGSAPFGIVMHPAGGQAYVSLYGSGELLRLSTTGRNETGRLTLGYSARAIAISPDGQTVLVTRFISQPNWGEVWRIDTGAWQVDASYRLHKHLENDSLFSGRGLPNYLAGVIISEDGTRAYIVGKKDNIDRGLVNDGPDLDDDNTVRTIAMTIDLENGAELRGARLDFDNTDSPSALAFSPAGNYLLVSMQGRNQVFVMSVAGDGRLTDIAAQFAAGHAPQAVYMDGGSDELFVKNFTDRTLSIIDLEQFLAGGAINPPVNTVATVAGETLAAPVLNGKRLFYDAADGLQSEQGFTGRMSAEGYLSCASCHIDGGHDGRTYDFTGRGEGLRNNISLKGRGGVRFGPVHWSANFDEIQDFENDIRNAFLGRGLMDDADFAATEAPLGQTKTGLSTDLDNLAAYVASLGKSSLPRSPHRNNNGTLTAAAVRGQTVFEELDCGSCHRPPAFTDGIQHDIGTTAAYSGNRLGGELNGIKTPSLLGLFDTAPYLHDGSADDLETVFISAGGEVFQAEDLISNGQLVEHDGYSYLRNGAGVRLAVGQSVTVNASLPEGGDGNLAVRYGSAVENAQLQINVNGNVQELNLAGTPAVDGEDVNFLLRKTAVTLTGGGNTIVLTLVSGNPATTVLLDDITLASPQNFTGADAHTRVANLSETDKSDLFAYLLQLDRSSAPADNETIELGATPDDEPGKSNGNNGSDDSGDDNIDSDESGDEEESDDEDGGGSTGVLFLLGLTGMLGLRLRRRRV